MSSSVRSKLSALLGGVAISASALAWDVGYDKDRSDEPSLAAKTVGCEGSRKPLGWVVYKLAEPGTGSGLRESIDTIVREGDRLDLITSSGEYLSQPFQSAWSAEAARLELCVDGDAFVDLSKCKIVRERSLFSNHACSNDSEARAAQTEALSALDIGLRSQIARMTAEHRTFQIESLTYSCSAPEYFYNHSKRGEARVLPSFIGVGYKRSAENYGILKRGGARMAALRKAFGRGEGTPGLISVQSGSCDLEPAVRYGTTH